MLVVNLRRIDPPPIAYTQFANEFENWLTNLVDEINFAMTQIENELESLDVRLTAIGG
jgi:hypothetical protein